VSGLRKYIHLDGRRARVLRVEASDQCSDPLSRMSGRRQKGPRKWRSCGGCPAARILPCYLRSLRRADSSSVHAPHRSPGILQFLLRPGPTLYRIFVATARHPACTIDGAGCGDAVGQDRAIYLDDCENLPHEHAMGWHGHDLDLFSGMQDRLE
jgi:hypothetical protein